MEGTFNHGAYGSISPCFVQSKTAGLTTACEAVFNTSVVQRILGASSADTIPTFIVPFKRFFATHLRFAHFSGNTFNASLIWSNSDARAEEGYPAEGTSSSGSTSGMKWSGLMRGRPGRMGLHSKTISGARRGMYVRWRVRGGRQLRCGSDGFDDCSVSNCSRSTNYLAPSSCGLIFVSW